jgi:PKD repeat protein
MNKKLLISLVSLVFFASYLQAQNVLYRNTFIQGATYCPTGTYGYKWSNYKSFRGKLNTTTKFFTEARMWGEVAQSNSVSSRTCTDKTVVRQLANALKNGIAYVGICNGYKWEVSASGTCNNGSCSAPTSEVVHFATYPSSASTGVCACGATDYWVIRTTIQNVNKGGIMVGGTGTTCNPSTQWIELEFKSIPPFNYDIATTTVPDLDRCTPTQNIKARFANLGKKQIDSFQYYVKVNTTNYGPYKFKGTLAPQKDTLLTVYSNYTFNPSTTYNITVWGAMPNNFNDSFAGDDTAKRVLQYNGTKKTPSANDTAVCGSQIVTLKAVPDLASDSLAWFSDRGTNQFLGFGKNFQTKYLASGAKYKFYVASYNGFVKGSISLGYTLTNGWPSAMFDLSAKQSDLTVDSLGLNIYDFNFGVGTVLDVEVYLREGSFNDAGATTTPSMWTKLGTYPVTCKGSMQRSVCKVSFNLTYGKNYAVYINPTQNGSNTILAKPSASTISDAEISLTGGTLNQLSFGTALTGYTIDRKMLCKSAPDSIEVNVKPSPYGSKLEPGIPFQVAPRNPGSGSFGKPQVIVVGDTQAYNLKVPTGYVNSDHNSTWKVANVMVKTLSGRVLTSYTWSDPSGSVLGRLAYTPTSTEVDSVIVAEVRLQDISKYFCDTIIKHYMYVAPLPVPDFTRKAKICDGDVIEFTNKSSILKGFLEFKWYFGDGDSSETNDPIKQYNTFGTYYVKLNAISSVYGYSRTKIDTVIVTQIPKVGFKIQNACEQQTHKFTNTTTVNSGTLLYSWDFGDMTANSSLKDPTHKYNTAGQYTVTLTASANGCVSKLSKRAYLFPRPVANFSFPNTGGIKYCTNTPVSFTNLSTISSGTVGALWTFEGGEFGTVNKPVHTFDVAGNFNIKLKAISEFGCVDSMTKPLTIFGAPKVSFTNSQVCDLTPTQFTNTTPAVAGSTANYSWNFGDGSKSTAASPSHQYTVLGPKMVQLIVKQDNSCSDSFSREVSVGTQANVDFDVANTCSGKEVQFENKTTFKQGKIAYKWLFGGVDSTSTADPKYTFNVVNSTTYTITLTAKVDGECESVLSKPMTVYELPKCDFTLSDDWTPGDGWRTVKVSANNTTYPFYRFKFSDGGNLSTSSGVYQFPYEGDFTVTMIARNQVDCECQTTQSKSIRNSLGTDNLGAGEVKLYPNPSTGLVNIAVSGSSQITGVEVYNLLGEKMDVNTKLANNTGTVEMGSVSDGIYLVKVVTNAGTVTRRITIHK